MLTELEKYGLNLIENEICPSMLNICDQINAAIYKNTILMPETLPQSLKYVNPGALFVKSVCDILSLDKYAANEVTKLENSCLKLLNTNIFSLNVNLNNFKFFKASLESYEAIFFCESCGHYVKPDMSTEISISDQAAVEMICPQFKCSKPLKRARFEKIMHDVSNKLIDEVFCAELECPRCVATETVEFSSTCKKCLQPLELPAHMETIKENLSVVAEISKSSGFDDIQEKIGALIV